MSHRMIRFVTAGIFASSTVVACASTQANARGAESSATTSNTTVIVATDLEATKAGNLYDAIRQLRPEWFRRTGATPIRNNVDHPLVVFVDNQRAGSIEILQQTAVTHAASVRYFSPSEAQMRFGNGNMNGVIQIVTHTGKDPDR